MTTTDQPAGACTLCDVVKPDDHALQDHVLNVHPDEHCGLYHQQPCQHGRRERYAVAIHDAMETDLSLVDQEPAYQALIARAAEAAVALADREIPAILRAVADLIDSDSQVSAAVHATSRMRQLADEMQHPTA